MEAVKVILQDAIKWVLGEQSAKSLRGSKMEKISSLGAEHRKAQNYAEVQLRLDNHSKSSVLMKRSYCKQENCIEVKPMHK